MKQEITCRTLWRWSANTIPLLVFALLFTVVSMAQIVTGSLSGTVNDQSGAILAGANITLTDVASKDVRRTVSNSSGYFSFPALRPSTYEITIEAKGFKLWKQTGIALNPGDTRSVSGIQLELGQATETVTVQSALGSVAPVDSGERSALLTTKDLENLALVGRNVTELLKVLPGVTSVANGTGNGSSGASFTDAGAGGSSVGNGLSTNGAPYRGGTALLSDGANILDPGCNCDAISVINPEMTQEVKVQTSNFGADNPKGPIVVNAISKAGGAAYHGAAYLQTRNGVLNSNDAENNRNKAKRPEEAYYYPGGNFGGPVPYMKNKLFTWSGYEYFWQKLPASTPLKSYIPTDDMLAGNFGSTTANSALCSSFTQDRTDWCADIASDLSNAAHPYVNYGPAGQLLTSRNIAAYVDPGAKAIAKAYFPKANADPSLGYNYYYPITNQHNGYIYRQRLDYNLSEYTKVFATYQYGTDTNVSPAHVWWVPGNSVPFPGGGITSTRTSHTFAANFLHVFNPTLTNEVVGSWQLATSPFIAPIKNVTRSATGYPYGTVFGNGALMPPGVYSPGDRTIPEMSQPDFFDKGGYAMQKTAYSLSDNLTKVYKTHTFKTGFYFEKSGNLQSNWANTNGVLSFASGNKTDAITGKLIGTNNPVANFVMGIASGYTETNSFTLNDENYRGFSFYGMDDWKLNRRITLNIGARFEHLGRWYDNTNVGEAAWIESRYQTDLAAGRAYPGVYWHGVDKNTPNGGYPTPNLLVSPRLGFAWDVRGTGKTVLRGGWGMYRWQDQPTGALGPGQGVMNYNMPSNNYMTLAELNSLSGTGGGSSISSSSVVAADPHDDKFGLTKAYSFTISQQLPWRSLMEVAYVGNDTSNILLGGQSDAVGVGGSDFINVNKVPKGALLGIANVEHISDLSKYRPFSGWYGNNTIRVPRHLGYSNYNGLQISWAKQGERLGLNLNYTWSKALGIVKATVDPYVLHGNYGILGIDRPHVFNASYHYQVGKLYRGSMPVLGSVTNDWTISGTTQWQAGANMQAQYSQNLGLTLLDTDGTQLTTKTYFGSDVGMILPTTTCNPFSKLKEHQTINLSCISAPAIGKQGLRQLPYFSGPAYFNSDLSLFKNFKVFHEQTIQFRASAFNFLNHPLLAFSSSSQITPSFQRTASGSWTPVGNTLTPKWGYYNTETGRRMVELGLKYTF